MMFGLVNAFGISIESGEQKNGYVCEKDIRTTQIAFFGNEGIDNVWNILEDFILSLNLVNILAKKERKIHIFSIYHIF